MTLGFDAINVHSVDLLNVLIMHYIILYDFTIHEWLIILRGLLLVSKLTYYLICKCNPGKKRKSVMKLL